MVDRLKDEGLTDVAFLAITTNATSWDDNRAPGFDEVTLPITLDSAGVFYLYSADSYDVILVDKKGRLVSKQQFPETTTAILNQRIRELHAE